MFRLALFLILFTTPALAQVSNVVAPSSWLAPVWSILQPFVATLALIVGPALAGWIGAKLITLLNITDEAKRKEVEKQLADALHKSATNAVQYAAARAGFVIPEGVLTTATPIIAEALEYIRNKNPDAIDAFGLDDKSLAEILIAKLPDVRAKIAAGDTPANAQGDVPIRRVPAPAKRI